MEPARIMVVEDESIAACKIQQSLERLGYSVTARATGGEEAVRKAAEDMPDLILMDIVLSDGMDGITAAENIRRSIHIPVVYLSAYSEEKLVERAKITEPYGYILKPCTDRELHIVIEIALYRARMEADRDRLLHTLRDTLEEVRLLSGLLPICAGCKKIRNDQGYWLQIEEYISTHSQARFTHSICPDCAQKFYRDITGMY